MFLLRKGFFFFLLIGFLNEANTEAAPFYIHNSRENVTQTEENKTQNSGSVPSAESRFS